MVIEIGKVPTWFGSNVGAIIKLGYAAITNVDAIPIFILTKVPVSPLSASKIYGNLKTRDLPRSIVMSESTGSKKGGEFEITANTGETLVIVRFNEMVTGTHPDIEPYIMRV